MTACLCCFKDMLCFPHTCPHLMFLFFFRTVIQPGTSQPDIQLLHPINFEFFVNRNLPANWYHKVPVVEIKGHLDTMNVSAQVKKQNKTKKPLVIEVLHSEDFLNIELPEK